ncbi:hypothetical protein DNK06_05190 [Pseudomonas daroniae]|uniref:Uncharacterized protein n=1 Tax=Phytopseudomonas daroniae TaxID=2487519 RepID=A0A4Q9QQ30_9GAMM|nr:hypothetical protein DNK06_05190 [Pseudomonas daroniae]TBU84747.1 hypothetical protein DNK31_07320 [Pseudomonas sp. FRB 228]TBU92218.1 hypothetical protein DNJ99_07335 [Pseudomonas daroniae]
MKFPLKQEFLRSFRILDGCGRLSLLLVIYRMFHLLIYKVERFLAQVDIKNLGLHTFWLWMISRSLFMWIIWVSINPMLRLLVRLELMLGWLILEVILRNRVEI